MKYKHGKEQKAMGKLTLVPTPIGNLKDITLRALDALREADLILAEDTRTSSILLKHYDIHKPLESHHKFNEFRTAEHIANRIIEEDLIVALISDAGTPMISDPGNMLVQACIAIGVDIYCLPGPSALIPALVLSGLPTDRFVFEGFLPIKKGRKTLLAKLAEEPRTIILYESPFRVLRTLKDFAEVCGEERPAATVREISKIHETTLRGSLGELITHYSNESPRGEFVILIGGVSPEKRKKTLNNSHNNNTEENNN